MRKTNDRRRIDLFGENAGGPSECFKHCLLFVADLIVQIQLILALFLHAADDRIHRLHHDHREFTDRCFAAQHHRIGAVQHGVRHVVRFGTGRTRIVDHRIEHLCGDNHRLPGGIGLPGNHLLRQRNLFRLAFHSEIAARHHDPVRLPDNVVDILQRFVLLDLGDDRKFFSFIDVRDDKITQLHHIRTGPDERQRDIIDIVGDSEQQIVPVFFRHGRRTDRHTRKVDPFVAFQNAAVHCFDDHFPFQRVEHLKLQQTVIHQDRVARFHILGKILICGGDLVPFAEHFIDGDDQPLAVVQGHRFF